MRDGDTIVALSSGAVPSGVAIIRLSGPQAGLSLTAVCGALPAPRRLSLASIRDLDGGIIDRGLVAWFPGPYSFTGEDCAELQLHGSPAVVRALLRRLTADDGVRLAEAGEFTRRAFENGRLDLTAVEGLGDLIAAETEGQRRQAISRFDGVLARQIDRWRDSLLDMRAEIEARLDFSDEGDVAADVPAAVHQGILDLRKELGEALASLSHGRIVREGLRVALGGPPNAGKSSLLNALVKSDLAIVSDEPGTTRDVREVAIDLNGQLVMLVDTAGLRETTSSAEAEGVRRARAAIAEADLVLWLVAPDVADSEPPPQLATPLWTIGTKSDLGLAATVGEMALSARSGAGITGLLERLAAFAAAATEVGSESPLLSRERDRAAVSAAAAALEGIEARFSELEIVAEALRVASDALRRLTGELDAESVLDRLFAGFCIGK